MPRPCGPGPEPMADKPLERINIATLREETVRSFGDAALVRLQATGVEPKDIAGIVRGAAVDTVGIVKSTRRPEWQQAHQPELASLARERSRALASRTEDC